MHSGVSVSGFEPQVLSFGSCQVSGKLLSLFGLLSTPIKKEQWYCPLQHHVDVGEAAQCTASDNHPVPTRHNYYSLSMAHMHSRPL